ncbi:Endoplasmic reticulum lectin 1, partial [Pseudolycoriella hygida]
IFLLVHLPLVFGHDLKGFDDTILFGLEWPGENSDLITGNTEEPLIVTTHNKEKYKCFIPSLSEVPKETETKYTGPGVMEIISGIFSSTSCSYRIESYWTYELCHGHYIKQFHEEREGKTSKKQEYFLGKWDKQKTDKLAETLAMAETDGEKLKYKKIEGLSLPYVELEMTDGTLCDLINNEPRVTKVLYVCYLLGKNEIYSLKEVSTCNYEVIILSPGLCDHPSYRPTETAENNINCVPLDGSPDKPKSLLDMELETLRTDFKSLSEMSKNVRTFAIYKIDPKFSEGSAVTDIITL